MAAAVLIVDDEPILAKNIATYLSRNGYETRTVTSGESCLSELDSFKPDVILMDYQMPGINGIEVLKQIRSRDSRIPVIMMTGHGNVPVAVDAMKSGAFDYLSKPLVLREVKLLLDKVIEQKRLKDELAYYQEKEAEQGGVSKLLGQSPAMTAMRNSIRQFIEAEKNMVQGEPPTVLITGETGTGKELIARAFHFDGPRRERPFVEINCAAVPALLMEAELFGFERGAFTDAKERKIGLVEMADRGTLFLDEIGEMELPLQAKLLRVLEDKLVRRLGSLRDTKVDVRVIAATNQALEEKVREGKFRSDLFFRLRVIHIRVPPLRERQGDILLLAQEFLKILGRRYAKGELRFSPETEQALLHYSWPGNVRELRNIIEQSVLLVENDLIEPRHVALNHLLEPKKETGGEGRTTLPGEGVKLEELERDLVEQALKRTKWNITQAARLLGLSRDTLRYRIEKYGLSQTL